ncbi:hypothetical protein FKM82_002640 [Ascaphus truei]
MVCMCECVYVCVCGWIQKFVNRLSETLGSQEHNFWTQGRCSVGAPSYLSLVQVLGDRYPLHVEGTFPERGFASSPLDSFLTV